MKILPSTLINKSKNFYKISKNLEKKLLKEILK